MGRPDSDNLLHRDIPTFTSLCIGGLAGMCATVVVHPLDVLKVRIQLSSKTTVTTSAMLRAMLRCQGVSALYSGVGAGLLRQATYTTTRLGVYNELTKYYVSQHSTTPPLRDKVMIGILAGLAGAVAGTPSEVALVRLMADGPGDPCAKRTEPRRYRGCAHALYSIMKTEGFFALWRGGIPTLSRSVFVSTAQIGTYAQTRDMLFEAHIAAGIPLHIYASLVSSLVTAVLTLPVDNIKTKFQASSKSEGQTKIFRDTVRTHGYLHLWNGFSPYYTRLALHTVITFVLIEQMSVMYERYVLKIRD